ncbi:MAG: AraC family transcriptional regulator [Rhodocyclaceae bacterium]|nr:AraC family transcriptional regulator [Rhodocyclaceae bacterium]
MQVLCRFPAPPLRPFVDRFWGWRSAPGERVALPRVLPGTGAEVFFHDAAPFRAADRDGALPLPQAHLLCLRSRSLPLLPQDVPGFVAVRLRAGRFGRLSATPLAECVDEPLPVEALWGAAGRALAAQVAEAAGFDARVDLIEAFLLRRLGCGVPDRLVEAAVDRLYGDPAGTTVARLADALAVGCRQLERRFLAAEGIAPAAFRRRVRFQKTVRRLLLDPGRPLLDAALEQGFHDQPHFCRDCRDLAGRPPGALLAEIRGATHFYNTSRR